MKEERIMEPVENDEYFAMPYRPVRRYDTQQRIVYRNHWFGEEKKKMFFYNNTENSYTVVLVNTLDEDVSKYEPAIKLKLRTMENRKRILTPVVALVLAPRKYMCVHTVNRIININN